MHVTFDPKDFEEDAITHPMQDGAGYEWVTR